MVAGAGSAAPPPLNHARSKLLCVASLCRTCGSLALSHQVLARRHEPKQKAHFRGPLVLVAGAGLEPATSWL